MKTQNPNKSIGAIVFDFDGVIADSMPLQERAWRQAFSLTNPPIDESSKALILKKFWLGYAGKQIFLDLSISANLQLQLRQIKDKLWEDVGNAVPIMDGVTDAIHKLKSVAPLFISTTAPREYVESNLKKFKLYSFFNRVITSEDVKCPKPAPDSLYAASDSIAIRPDQLLMIGDTLIDQETAEAARSQFVLFRPHVLTRAKAGSYRQYYDWQVLVRDLIARN